MADSTNQPFSSSTIRNAEAEDYGKVINHLLASSLAGRAQLWPRSELFQPQEPSYFKPETNLYRETLRRDRRNGKELEYIQSTGTWLEKAVCALELFKKSNDANEQGRLLSLMETSLFACKETLAMRTTHFHAILTKGPAMARQLADLVEARVEANHSQVQSDAYATVYEELSAKYIVETAKAIAKDQTSTLKRNSTDGKGRE